MMRRVNLAGMTWATTSKWFYSVPVHRNSLPTLHPIFHTPCVQTSTATTPRWDTLLEKQASLYIQMTSTSTPGNRPRTQKTPPLTPPSPSPPAASVLFPPLSCSGSGHRLKTEYNCKNNWTYLLLGRLVKASRRPRCLLRTCFIWVAASSTTETLIREQIKGHVSQLRTVHFSNGL